MSDRATAGWFADPAAPPLPPPPTPLPDRDSVRGHLAFQAVGADFLLIESGATTRTHYRVSPDWQRLPQGGAVVAIAYRDRYRDDGTWERMTTAATAGLLLWGGVDFFERELPSGKHLVMYKRDAGGVQTLYIKCEKLPATP
jgi:hypothetical protein